MKNYNLFTLFISAALLLASCSDIIDLGNQKETPLDEPKVNTDVIQRLEVGNYFKYKVQAWIQERDKDTVLYHDFEILRDTVINGTRWYTSDTNGIYWMGNKPDGLYSMEIRDGKVNKVSLEFKYPAKVGDTFYADTLTWTVSSTDTAITVGAGKFRCYHYSGVLRDFKGYKEHRFYCPGIGRIKQEIYWYLVRKEKIASTELIEYKIKNGN